MGRIDVADVTAACGGYQVLWMVDGGWWMECSLFTPDCFPHGRPRNFRRINSCSGLALAGLAAARGSVPLSSTVICLSRASPRPPQHAAGPLDVAGALAFGC
jgi:hypothetical protein